MLMRKTMQHIWAHQILTPREQGSHVCIILFNPDLVAAVVTLKYLLKCSEKRQISTQQGKSHFLIIIYKCRAVSYFFTQGKITICADTQGA